MTKLASCPSFERRQGQCSSNVRSESSELTYLSNYGSPPENSDSAASNGSASPSILSMSDKSAKTDKMDDYAQRYPTNVLDIALFQVHHVYRHLFFSWAIEDRGLT
jgi:hypothetical protein